MSYARDPYDTEQPPCFCGPQETGPAFTTEEFCPAHGDPDKPAPEPLQGDITPDMFDHPDDYAQATAEARWECRQPNPCACPDCREALDKMHDAEGTQA